MIDMHTLRTFYETELVEWARTFHMNDLAECYEKAHSEQEQTLDAAMLYAARGGEVLREHARTDHEVPLVACRCGGKASVEDQYYGIVISCSDCYDGAPDSGPQAIVGVSFQGTNDKTMAAAVLAWNEFCEGGVA